jgi:dynein heavy chain
VEAYIKQERESWVKIWPGQAVLCVTAKYWTDYIHEALNKGGNALADYLNISNEQINNIVAMVRGKLSKQNRVRKLTRTAIFFTRTTKPICNFVNPETLI